MGHYGKLIAHVTRENLSWAVEFTGYSREELISLLEKAEAEDVVCTVMVK